MSPAPSPDRRLAPEARRQEIVRLLLERDLVTVQELAERFGVSKMTIHRDLDILEERLALRKVHGGATAQPSSLYESTLSYRLTVMTEAKRKIARRAVQFVTPGSSLILDNSTTTLAMVPYLIEIPHLTVITNFLSVLEHYGAAGQHDATLILIGGNYRTNYNSTAGILTERMLTELHADRCFISSSAIDVRAGIFHQEAEEARLKAAMIAAAKERYLLIDSSKFSKSALYRVTDLESFDRIIVDAGISPEVLEELSRRGVPVDVAV